VRFDRAGGNLRAREKVVDLWAAQLWLDHLTVTAVVGAHVALTFATGSGDWLAWISASQRASLYSASTGVISAIGGLSAIAISIYTATNGERLRAVRREHHGELRRNWKSLLLATGFCCLLTLFALSLDKEGDPNYSRFLFEYALGFSAMRFTRLIWLFDRMMRISDADLSEPARVAPPTRDPDWVRRRQKGSPQ